MQLRSCLILLLLIYSEVLWAQKSIKLKEGVMINGIKQHLAIDSKDDQKPILLFLHGGPGFSSRPYFHSIKKGIQNDFIVVQWDQRETGITKAWNEAPKPITTAQMHQDTEEVVNYVLNKFNRDKLILIGFSWGNYLGMTYASKHPEKIMAYVNVSGMISNEESERLTRSLIKEKAEKEGNTEAIEQIQEIKIPFENWEELAYQRRWTAYYNGAKNVNRVFPSDLLQTWSETWFEVFLSASKEDFRETIPALDCPVFFMASKKDLVANFEVSAAYFEALKAEKKELIWFEESTHEIPSQEPKKFIKELLRIGKIKN